MPLLLSLVISLYNLEDGLNIVPISQQMARTTASDEDGKLHCEVFLYLIDATFTNDISRYKRRASNFQLCDIEIKGETDWQLHIVTKLHQKVSIDRSYEITRSI